MNKSVIYKIAMCSVIRDEEIDMDKTIEILDVLMQDKRMAEMVESAAQKKEDSQE